MLYKTTIAPPTILSQFSSIKYLLKVMYETSAAKNANTKLNILAAK
ncbi:hypothetical protein IMSAGC022_00023 [Alistipes sp.]|nr:hypothetical protein IMSAGC022_00023 [Alistipes sp.]